MTPPLIFFSDYLTLRADAIIALEPGISSPDQETRIHLSTGQILIVAVGYHIARALWQSALAGPAYDPDRT